MDIRLEPIVPSFILNADVVAGEIETAMEGLLDEVEGYYKAVTNTWDERPKIERELVVRGGDIHGTVWSDDKRMLWLDEGTDVRHAVMERGFISKTVPNSLSSRKGRGGLAFVHPRLMLPGIEARNWTEQIIKRVKIGPAIRRAIVRGVVKGAASAITAPVRKLYRKVFKK